MSGPSRPGRQKTCARCGRAFECGPPEGESSCWCEKLPHALPFTGEDCACPDCAAAEIARMESARRARAVGRRKIALSWSGGKDSAMALAALLCEEAWDIVALVTTITEDYDRVSMHGVRRELLERQALRLGVPLRPVLIARECGNEAYEARMGAALEELRAQGVAHVAFGDIFLEDLRRYRDENLARLGLTGVYPLWKRDTAELAREFIARGFRAILSCVDTQALDASFAGRKFDAALLADLPAGVDPCGERGEFHTFVYAGPIFPTAVACRVGERSRRDGRFEFRDIVPS